MPHVDEGTLHALLDGALRAEEPGRAREVEAHLEACADCRARLDHAASLRDEAAGILAGLDTATGPAPSPDFQEVLARAAAEDASPDARPTAPDTGSRTADDRFRRQHRWTRGLAWAATIVVALGTGYLVGDLAGPTGRIPARSSPAEQADVDLGADALETEGLAPAAETPGPGAAEGRQEVVPPGADGVTGAADTGARRQARARNADEPGAGTQRNVAEDISVAQEAAARGGMEEAGEPLAAAEAATPTVPAEAETPELMDFAGDVRKATEADLVTGIGWVQAELAEAEALVGPILVLPDGEITRVEVPDGGQPLARTRQMLPGGVEVEVVQATAVAAGETGGEAVAADAAPTPMPEAAARRAPEEGQAAPAPALVEARALVLERLDSVAADPVEVQSVGVERDGLILTLTARVPADVLRALALAATPRQP